MSERADRGERVKRVGRLWNGGDSMLAVEEDEMRHKVKEKKEMDRGNVTYFLEVTKTPIPNQ